MTTVTGSGGREKPGLNAPELLRRAMGVVGTGPIGRPEMFFRNRSGGYLARDVRSVSNITRQVSHRIIECYSLHLWAVDPAAVRAFAAPIKNCTCRPPNCDSMPVRSKGSTTTFCAVTRTPVRDVTTHPPTPSPPILIINVGRGLGGQPSSSMFLFSKIFFFRFGSQCSCLKNLYWRFSNSGTRRKLYMAMFLFPRPSHIAI